MENITVFIEQNMDYYLLLIIVLGGIFITKYFKGVTRLKDVYKVLIASILFSVVFYIIQDCQKDCLSKYLFTYLFATSFYELIVKFIIDKIVKAFGGLSANSSNKSLTGDAPDPSKEEK